MNESAMVQQINKPNQEEINRQVEEYDYEERPIWEIVVEIGKQITDEELDKIPTDLARNFDSYCS